jgi:hypothetical protein
VAVGIVCLGAAARAQAPEPQERQHEPAPQPAASSWHLMQDGVVYGLFNRQGGPRGGSEFVVPNWWMGMWTRAQGAHEFGINAMLSVDPATVGAQGYREIFQVGETFEGEPLVDYQHPHDMLMQLSSSWRRTVGSSRLMITGALAGEPTLGPVAFMHRPSAAGLPLAPLGHHTFDSTHISFGVITAGLERGRWAIEGSVFNGREPDEHRWNVDVGALDSVAARVWFAPTPEWTIQVSSGKLREPEALVPGDAVRTTVSGSWFRQHDRGFRAVTVGYGANSAHGARRHGVFGELTIEQDALGLSLRLEQQDVETGLLLGEDAPGVDHPHDEPPAAVTALTVGGTRRLFTWRGFDAALGAQAAFYQVPQVLRATHGSRPVSFQVFFRLRLPSGPMGRMWNMVMSRGYAGPADQHAGHVIR